MKASLATLKKLLLNNVAEIKFVRRLAKPGFPPTRRMLCTNSLKLLNSPEGRLALNYRKAYHTPKYRPELYDLLVTWDIIMQDYRQINLYACDIIQVIPANKQFWKFFNEKLALLTPKQKIVFMQQ